MTKASGLGMALYLGGYDLSGDIGSVEGAKGSVALLDVTGIDKSAFERVGGLRQGSLAFSSYWNVDPGQAQAVLKALPTTDLDAMMLAEAAAIGAQAACLRGKQIDFAPQRGKDGSLVATTSLESNGFPLHWCELLTAGKRTDTVARSGSALDGGASTSFGLSAYLQVLSFTGADITIALEDSANNSTWAPVTGGAFASVTAAPGTQFIQTATAATIRRYLRVTTSTTLGFDQAIFAVAVVRHRTSTI